MIRLYGKNYDHSDPDGSMLVCADHERNLLEFVSGKGDASGTFIDIGANVGLWALSLRDEYAKVIAIEPHPVAFKSLNQNCVDNLVDNVVSFNLAAGASRGAVELITFAHSGHTTSNPGWKHGLENIVGKPTGKIISPMIAVDSLAHVVENKVSFVKIDTEGSEAEVIRGMGEMLQKDKPMLLIEIHKAEDVERIPQLIPGRIWETLAYGGSQYFFSQRVENA
jgi:FkbM family methyltransferase